MWRGAPVETQGRLSFATGVEVDGCRKTLGWIAGCWRKIQGKADPNYIGFRDAKLRWRATRNRRPKADFVRTRWLSVIRFWNPDVLGHGRPRPGVDDPTMGNLPPSGSCSGVRFFSRRALVKETGEGGCGRGLRPLQVFGRI